MDETVIEERFSLHGLARRLEKRKERRPPWVVEKTGVGKAVSLKGVKKVRRNGDQSIGKTWRQTS